MFRHSLNCRGTAGSHTGLPVPPRQELLALPAAWCPCSAPSPQLGLICLPPGAQAGSDPSSPVPADGELTDTLSCPHSTASEANGGRAAARSPTLRHNPFNQDKAESSADTTPVHAAARDKADATPEGTDQSESCTELEVIR